MTLVLVLAWAALAVAAARRARPARPSGWDPSHGGPAVHRPPPQSRPGRRRGRRREAAIADAVPDVIDLFAVAVAAGLNTRLALRAVAERGPPGVLTDALADVARRVETTGARLADVLDDLPRLVATEAVRPFVAAITDAERYGAALGPTLDRLADEARRTRQRRAEEAARRIPVKLLFPLVLCILPAFGLLTVAPLIAGGLRALRL